MATASQKTERAPKRPAPINDPLDVTIIRPRSSFKLIDIKELRQYRDLFYFLVLREIKVRYKQTVLGGLWAILQPLLSMIVFSLFFGRLAQIPSDGVPYPIFSFAALVPWIYFSNALSYSSNSLIANQAFINKVYFPRVAIPAAPIIGWLLDFVIAMAVLFIMMVAYGIAPTPLIALLPLLVLIMIFAASGAGIWLAALNVHYRDFRYVVPFMIQLWMFISPVVYPVSLVPEKWRFLYAFNPMAGVIEGFRSALLGTIDFPWTLVGASTLTSVLILLSGLFYFKKTERFFADIA
ncbi:MAG: ABC transporter permease [Actinomycetia bacterium]|nr:ABC transporter permease [Actinomycetes bacterium]